MDGWMDVDHTAWGVGKRMRAGHEVVAGTTTVHSREPAGEPGRSVEGVTTDEVASSRAGVVAVNVAAAAVADPYRHTAWAYLFDSVSQSVGHHRTNELPTAEKYCDEKWNGGAVFIPATDRRHPSVAVALAELQKRPPPIRRRAGATPAMPVRFWHAIGWNRAHPGRTSHHGREAPRCGDPNPRLAAARAASRNRGVVGCRRMATGKLVL